MIVFWLQGEVSPSHVVVVSMVEAAVLFLHVREPGVVIWVDIRQVHLTKTRNDFVRGMKIS